MLIDNVIDCKGALVVGAGIAGLFTALKLSPFPALVLAGRRPGASGSSAWAQGGIAAAMGSDDDWKLHAADTMRAGAGTCDGEVVAFVTRKAPDRINDLIAFGVPFDRSPDGSLSLAQEAAHSRARIVHVSGDRAGAEISRVLAERAFATPSIQFAEGFQAIELATQDGRMVGVFARHGIGAQTRLALFRSHAVILATGGIGALYAVTTNPAESTGQGLGMAARAGAAIADPEFVQFHPTAIAVGRDPAPLATEALRGEGAILIDESGRRFMPAVHPDAELAPRDVVARAIHREIVRGHRVFLDCRDAISGRFAEHFPTVYAACKSAGINPTLDPIPVAPAAHYHMGGVATDHAARSSLSGLWAVGECASTGLHGANRLASNSLLEALVVGARAAEDIRGRVIIGTGHDLPPAPSAAREFAVPQVLRDAMSRYVGLERTEQGLRTAAEIVAGAERAANGESALLNMTATAKLVIAGALRRRESRGAHFRTDCPRAAAEATCTRMTAAEADAVLSGKPSRTAAACTT
ncbi:MAG TPA: L-aspartate oxidase [Rhizomicrobium sp.]|jgi:L-aspartate oxidase